MKTVLLFAEFSNSGGTRTYAKQLVELFAKRGFRLHVVGTNSGDEEFRAYCEERGVTYEESLSNVIPSILDRLLRPIMGRAEETRIMNSYFREIAPDVVISSAGTPAKLLGSRFGFSPNIYLLHSYPTPSTRRWRVFLDSLFFPLRLPRKTRYLTVSQASKNHTKAVWGMRSSRFCFDVVLSTAGACLPREATLKEKSFTVLTVGHVANHKGPDIWLETARRVLQKVPASRFVWLGDGALLHEYREKAAWLGLESQVVFPGHVSHVEEYLIAADIYFQPSRVESLGLSVLDSMRVGIPSVVSSHGGLSELVVDGITGFIVDPLESGVAAKRIVDLYKKRVLARQMGDNARERYRDSFGPGIWEQKILRIVGV